MMIKVLFTLLFCSSVFVAQNTKGTLVIIGGGERPKEVMETIVNLAGQDRGKLLVIPMASSVPLETAKFQVEQFKEHNIGSADFLIFAKEEANSDSVLEKISWANCIFFSGGDQNRLTEILLGTKALEKIKEIYISGGVISGTSAGAAVMSEIMITGDEIIHNEAKESFGYIQKNNIATAQGFGFVKNAIIDQHFIYRKRHNRLLSLILENPNLLGIGIDESTAIKLSSSNILEVLGDYQVIIYDATKASIISNFGDGLLKAHDIKLHILSSGDKFNIETKEIVK
jgi:cyanophycinase